MFGLFVMMMKIRSREEEEVQKGRAGAPVRTLV